MTGVPMNLIQASQPFLQLVTATKSSEASPKLETQLQVAHAHFMQHALRESGDPVRAGCASMLLCTLCDELMMQHFGLGWSRNSLLLRFHGQAHVGHEAWLPLEKFLTIGVELSVADIDLLMLYELVLALGWRGRYRMEIDGETKILKLRQVLHDKLHAANWQEQQKKNLYLCATQHLSIRNYWGYVFLFVLFFSVLISTIIVDWKIQRRWLDLMEPAPLSVSQVIDCSWLAA